MQRASIACSALWQHVADIALAGTAGGSSKSVRQEANEKEAKKLLDEEEERRKTRRRKKVFACPECCLEGPTDSHTDLV